jgi:hypothetical protein
VILSHNLRQQDIASEQGIKVMPTFIAYKDGAKIGEATGAILAKLNVSAAV